VTTMTGHTSTGHRGWTLALASLGVFMTSLDTLVVATSLPVLRADLGAQLGDLEWTVNAYNLSFACLLLTGAALGDRFGRKRMFAVGLALFTLASALAALSPTIGALIAARAFQGAGAAIVMPMTLTLISQAFPVEKRGAAIGMWGGVTGTAVAVGPLVGGAVIDGINWHWIFWINVPVGLILIPLVLSRLSESHGPRPQLDIVGLLLVASGFFGLTWGLIRANTLGWSSSEVLGSMIGGAVLVAAFLAYEARSRTAMISFALFRSRGFSASNAVSFWMWAALFGALFLMTQFLQTGLGNGPLEAGLKILPWTGAPMVIAPIAGALADRYGNRPFLVAGLILQTIGLAWVAAIAKPGMGYGELAIALGVAGVGISLVFPTVANAVVGSVPASEMGVAAGTNSALREIGGVFGIALIASVFAHHGSLRSPPEFVAGFTSAIWLAAAFSALGVVAALMVPAKAGITPEEEPLVLIPTPSASGAARD
jgi:EmrB/QacA subfamily drug resistance transporter